MPRRKREIASGELYHIVTKSIADFKIFNTPEDYNRMMEEIICYTVENPPCEFRIFKQTLKNIGETLLVDFACRKKIIDIIAYCIMPTHIHFILEQLIEGGISKFMGRILQSYTQYFNAKHKRNGPLWEGRFKNILIEDNNLFEHITRYIHLNPVTAYLVNKPENWLYSSYREYIGLVNKNNCLCHFSHYLDMDSSSYAKFVNDRIAYQRELALIKHLTID